MDKGHEQEVPLMTGINLTRPQQTRHNRSTFKSTRLSKLRFTNECSSGLEAVRCAGNVSGALATALHVGTLGIPTMS